MALTADQQQRVDRARTVLGEPSGYEPAGMAGHIGRLEWHLQELLALIGDLAPEFPLPADRREAEACFLPY